MTKSFKDGRLDELADVPWLESELSQGTSAAVGDAQDAELALLKDGIKARFPLLAPADALPYLANDRGILQAPGESSDAFAVRLSHAPSLGYWLGTKQAILSIFEPFGLAEYQPGEPGGWASTQVQVFNNDEITWDDNKDWFSRVFILIDSRDGPWLTDGVWPEFPVVGDNWEEGEDVQSTWDSTATVAQLAYIRSSIRKVKSDHAYPAMIGVWLSALPDGYWNSNGTYDDGGNWAPETDQSQTLYWIIGHTWGEEQFLGGLELWGEAPAEPGTPLEEQDKWIAFADEE